MKMCYKDIKVSIFSTGKVASTQQASPMHRYHWNICCKQFQVHKAQESNTDDRYVWSENSYRHGPMHWLSRYVYGCTDTDPCPGHTGTGMYGCPHLEACTHWVALATSSVLCPLNSAGISNFTGEITQPVKMRGTVFVCSLNVICIIKFG